ncbi:hypothetical protein [Mariniflexile maritimum]|uniref:hypothetical protein n=1 Tax=Mariniflexile maritimum TaxID=2682493 RepID=UPI0012F682F2|nr:hypothetical protein [Mariniflexile maritimum]
MAKTAYFSLVISIILFLTYLIIKIFDLKFNEDILFYLSAVILFVSIVLFRKLNTEEVIFLSKKEGKYDEVLRIKYDELLIKTIDKKNDNENAYDDIDFNRIDSLLVHDSNNKYIRRYFIVYVSKTKKRSYCSQPLNIDIKTLEIKLYLEKNINLYIDTMSGNYFFGLDFLKQ